MSRHTNGCEPWYSAWRARCSCAAGHQGEAPVSCAPHQSGSWSWPIGIANGGTDPWPSPPQPMLFSQLYTVSF